MVEVLLETLLQTDELYSYLIYFLRAMAWN